MDMETQPNTGSAGSPMQWDVRGFQDALKGPTERPPWVIEGLLMEQSATLVSAHPHALKSLSWLGAALEATARKKVWGHFAAPMVENTLFIETEDPAWLVEARIRGFANGLGLSADEDVPGFHYACIGPFDLVKEESRLNQLVEQYQLDFMVISTLQNLLSGKNWLSQEEMQPIMAMIVRLSRACPVVLLTHSPWDRNQRRAAGTITQTANFLTTMHYAKGLNHQNGETIINVQVDSKAGGGEPNFSLSLITDGDVADPGSVRRLEYLCEGWPKGSGRDAVLAAIEEDPAASAKDIADRTDVSPRYVQKIMADHDKKRRNGGRK
jgi:hypothetical protein